MNYNVNIRDLAGVRAFANSINIYGDNFLLARVNRSVDSAPDPHVDAAAADTFSFNGITFLLCLEGSIVCELSHEVCELGADSLIVLGPEDLLKPMSVSPDSTAYILFLSHEFVRDINFDPRALQSMDFLQARRTRLRHLSSEECATLRRYLDLLLDTTAPADDTEEIFTRNIARNLVAAIFYHLILVTRRVAASDHRQPLTRRSGYVQNFISLVHAHHRQERSVKFYADRLFISPKYLSLLIKEATGRSAAQWIDDSVILEAKNLLRFSGMNVQQVAYALNFSNQSSFGKYFKHLTGLSPTAFQNS